MLAVDTNVWIAFLKQDQGPDIQIMRRTILVGGVCMPPVVFSELLSDPKLPLPQRFIFEDAAFMHPHEGYWERGGLMRAALIKKGFNPKLPDTLIAQSCIDHKVPLLTRDRGFEMFEEHAGLKLVKP